MLTNMNKTEFRVSIHCSPLGDKFGRVFVVGVFLGSSLKLLSIHSLEEELFPTSCYCVA